MNVLCVCMYCDIMYFMQRDMSCVNLALCLPCPTLSVAYVKDRRLSGGPGISSSPFTSDLLMLPYSMTLTFWNLCWFYFVINTLFGAVLKYLLLPIFVLSKIIFSPLEKYTAPTSPPPIPLPLHLQYYYFYGFQLALSKALWTKFITNYHQH